MNKCVESEFRSQIVLKSSFCSVPNEKLEKFDVGTHRSRLSVEKRIF